MILIRSYRWGNNIKICCRNFKHKFRFTLKNLKNQYYFHSIETDITPQIDIINQTNSGIIVRDSEHLLEVLKDLYDEYQATGQIACDSIGVEKYSRKIQVEKLAELIKSI